MCVCEDVNGVCVLFECVCVCVYSMCEDVHGVCVCVCVCVLIECVKCVCPVIL